MHSQNQSNDRYKPRSGKIGKSLSRYSNQQLKAVHEITKDMMQFLGYELPLEQLEKHGQEPIGANSSQQPAHFFPSNLKCPSTCLRKGKPASARNSDTRDYTRANKEFLLRKRNDCWGRDFCYLRQRQCEPIVAVDGTELNMDEVTKAREIMGVIDSIIVELERRW